MRISSTPPTLIFVHDLCFFLTQAPLGPAAGGAGYALRLQGQQCLKVSSPPLEDTGELVAGVWLNPSQVNPFARCLVFAQ